CADTLPCHRLTTILISRFILNLRDFDRSRTASTLRSQPAGPSGLNPGDTKGISSRFASFVEPLGAQLHGFGGVDDDEPGSDWREPQDTDITDDEGEPRRVPHGHEIEEARRSQEV
ncbi:hypothetical protein C8Q74DRAFT_1312602, partial [Fomes fomentarius]